VAISADARLGRQFRIGHSYVTPTSVKSPSETRPWFKMVVENEIRPLLEEYWFDSPNKAREATQGLVEGL
jgi:5-methylcytosine-specific restriction protein B